MRAPLRGACSVFSRMALASSNQAESRVGAPSGAPRSSSLRADPRRRGTMPALRRILGASVAPRGRGATAPLRTLSSRLLLVRASAKRKAAANAAARMRVYSSVQNSISRRHRPSSSPCRSEGTSEVCTSSAEPEAHEMIASPAGLPSKPDGARARWSPVCFSAYPHRARPKCPRPPDPVLCFEKT